MVYYISTCVCIYVHVSHHKANKLNFATSPFIHFFLASFPLPCLFSSSSSFLSFFLSIERCTESEESQVSLANTMEEVISFYCKSRNMTYTEETGWVELLAPLASLGLPKGDLFNCLYVLMAKFIPR